jgi:hypothetical protein
VCGPNLSSAATAQGIAGYFNLSTVAAAFTMTAGAALYVDIGNKGAGSSITTMYGLYITSQTIGGTNYAIYTNTGTVHLGDVTTVGVDPGDPVTGLSHIVRVGGNLVAKSQLTALGATGISPEINWYAPDQALDTKQWDIVVAGASKYFRVVNDANTLATNWLTVTRSGIAISNVTFPNGPVLVGAPIGGVSTSALFRVGGEIAAATNADATPFTQARISVYRDASNWGYLAYGSDAIMRVIYSQTAVPQSLQIGTSSAVDNTGTFVSTVRISPAQVQLSPDLNFSATATGIFDNTMTRFGGGAAPARAYDVWSYDGTAAKWRPRFLQASVGTGVLNASANGDGTYSVSAFSVTYNNATPAVPAAPIATPIYGGFILDMGAVPPSGSSYVIDYQHDAGAYTSGALVFTSRYLVFQFFSANGTLPFGTTGSPFQFKAKGRGKADGTFDSAYSATTGNVFVLLTTEVNAFGLIIASQIACVNLAAISADLGVVSAGVIADAIPAASQTKGIFIKSTAFQTAPGANWTSGIFFAGANPIPASITGLGIDFTATGTNPLLKHPAMLLRADGSALFTGRVKSQVGMSTTQAYPVQVLFQTTGKSVPGTSTSAQLDTFSVAANTLTNNGDTLRITCFGRVTAAAGTAGGATFVVRFGGTLGSGGTQVGFTNTAVMLAGDRFTVAILITRTGAATQVAVGSTNETDSGVLAFNNTTTAPAQTLSGAVSIFFEGTTGNNSINLDYAAVEYLGA